ncbi:MAG: hypothetical protein ACF8GE_02195 [Phycisphaerales bacterium JB043]
MRSIERTEAQTTRFDGRPTWLGPDRSPETIGARIVALARVASAIHMAQAPPLASDSRGGSPHAPAQAGTSCARTQEKPL